jgi:hypothetical protein
VATITAVRSGNWSDTSHVTGPWPGASTPTTKPASGDTVEAASYVITIDESVTVATLQATANGRFEVANAQNITVGTIGPNGTVANGLIRCTHTTGTVTITLTTCNCNRTAIYNADVGAVQITGSLIGGTNSDAYGVYNAGAGTVTVTGSVTGRTQARSYGAHNAGVGTITVSGNATGGSNTSAHGAYNASTGTLAIAGVVSGGSNSTACGLFGNASGGVTTYEQIGSETNGNSAVGGFCKMLVDATNQITVKRSDTGADYILRPGGAGGRFGLASGGIL